MRRLSRFGWVVLMIVGLGLLSSLYMIKAKAEAAKREVRALEKTIEREQASLRVLEAEIAYLERPERLSQLSQDVLDLQPTSAERNISLVELIEQIPLREPSYDAPLLDGVKP